MSRGLGTGTRAAAGVRGHATPGGTAPSPTSTKLEEPTEWQAGFKTQTQDIFFSKLKSPTSVIGENAPLKGVSKRLLFHADCQDYPLLSRYAAPPKPQRFQLQVAFPAHYPQGIPCAGSSDHRTHI